MLTFVEKSKPSVTTTLNDIPAGTIFKGTVIGNTGKRYTGVFFRLYCGNYLPPPGLTQIDTATVLAVSLNLTQDWAGRAIPVQFLHCRPVENYVPLSNPKLLEE